MNQYQQEQIENIRRTAERGLEYGHQYINWDDYVSRTVDTFQHVIDLVEQIKVNNNV